MVKVTLALLGEPSRHATTPQSHLSMKPLQETHLETPRTSRINKEELNNVKTLDLGKADQLRDVANLLNSKEAELRKEPISYKYHGGLVPLFKIWKKLFKYH